MIRPQLIDASVYRVRCTVTLVGAVDLLLVCALTVASPIHDLKQQHTLLSVLLK